MPRLFPRLLIISLSLTLACGTSSDSPPERDENQTTQENQDSQENQTLPPDPVSLRVATFNASLYGASAGATIERFSDPSSEQPRAIAMIIQVKRPDILFLNEFDYDADGEAGRLFDENFLRVGQGGQEPIEYPYIYQIPSNTGVLTGIDLVTGEPLEPAEGSEEWAQNSFGFGTFEGQYASAIFSKYPLDLENARFFQTFLWKDMPDHRIPTDYYSEQALEILRLSSKNHVDIPVLVDGHVLHILGAHPTPPAFDGPEQRNVRRNHDEVRLIHDYIAGQGSSIYDDSGTTGGLDEEAYFVIVGDLNADPHDGGSSEAIAALLAAPRVQDPLPESTGGQFFGERDGGANDEHLGPHKLDTADFNRSVGNLRVDYAIPSSNLTVNGSAVFWPAPGEPHANLVRYSDHRLVWVDVTLGAE